MLEDPLVSIRREDGSLNELRLADARLSDFTGSEPWRKVRSVHGQAHYSGTYASSTMRGPVVYESRLELARLLLADFDPEIKAIYAQPCLLMARIEGRARRHVPDFLLVTRADVVRVVNVKPADRLEDPKVREALAWAGDVFSQRGWDYEIWSGADPVVLANVRFLAAYRRAGVVPLEEVERAWETVHDGERLAEAERRLAGGNPPHVARPAVLSLLWSGRLITDLSRPLGGDSVLRRSA
ncbi:hypothetical protein ABH931_007963 [Streptacidiphilus sp. MAP12-33]|uniref:TnsA-like heteromeric transposase endonuclease subunit n=1 Tax=Streptacidiphilus sp. MAP12-33 TaxID=3156266 RepID=UPI00351767FB